MLTALLVLAGLATVQALAFLGLAVRATLKLPRLEQLTSPDPARWPTVSLLVPARNEAQGLEAALRSKLTLDYPALQVVLIDDRSTDETGAIADRLAAEDPRLVPVHVRELPEGWLGKVHALQRGLEQASGEWVLLSDADIHYAPDTLRRAIARCEAEGIDFLCAMPTFVGSTPLVNVCLGAFGPLVLGAVQADWVADPRSKTSIGAGVFALVRRSALEKTPGLEWLKLEVGDDVALGMMMKRSGARCAVVGAQASLSVQMYRDFRGVVQGTAKAACSVSRYRLLPQVLIPAVMIALTLAPWVGLAVGLAQGHAWLSGVGALGAVAQVATSVVGATVFRLPVWPALFVPVGTVLLHGIIGVAGTAALLRGYVEWRGTRYPVETLRAASRYRFPWES
jgi:hypothetical protein